MALSALGLVFVGGGLGAVARYGLVRGSEAVLGSSFPYGVLLANILGSLAMGLVVGWLLARGSALAPFMMLAGQDAARLALTTGLLGGFTTFSAFSLDAVRLWEAGAPGAAIVYVFLSVVLAISALVVGLLVARMVWA